MVKALDVLHFAMMGVPPIPMEVHCSRDWTPAKQGSFPVPEGASGSHTLWVPSAPPTDKGEEPMTDVSHPFTVMYNAHVEADLLLPVRIDSLALAELLFSLESLRDLCCLVTGFSNL